MERAVHGLQVVLLALAADVTVGIHDLVEHHRRVHAVGIPLQVAARHEQVALRDVRRVHDLVAAGEQALAHVALDLVADDAALGVEHAESGADLVGEREEVELLAELAVVALGRLFQTLLVRAQLVLRGPRGAVDALQLRVLLAAAPVGAGDASEIPAVGDIAGAGNVGPAAQVAPDDLAVAVDVLVDRELPGADLCGGTLGGVRPGARATSERDELELERLVCHELSRLGLVDHAADEALVLADDALHLLLDGLEVLGSERVDVTEVEVEAVGDRRADAQVRLRLDALHGLGHHVRGGVAQDRQTVGAVDQYGLDRVIGRDDRREVFQVAVDAQSDDGAVGEQGEAVGGIGHVRRG